MINKYFKYKQKYLYLKNNSTGSGIDSGISSRIESEVKLISDISSSTISSFKNYNFYDFYKNQNMCIFDNLINELKIDPILDNENMLLIFILLNKTLNQNICIDYDKKNLIRTLKYYIIIMKSILDGNLDYDKNPEDLKYNNIYSESLLLYYLINKNITKFHLIKESIGNKFQDLFLNNSIFELELYIYIINNMIKYEYFDFNEDLNNIINEFINKYKTDSCIIFNFNTYLNMEKDKDKIKFNILLKNFIENNNVSEMSKDRYISKIVNLIINYEYKICDYMPRLNYIKNMLVLMPNIIKNEISIKSILKDIYILYYFSIYEDEKYLPCPLEDLYSIPLEQKYNKYYQFLNKIPSFPSSKEGKDISDHSILKTSLNDNLDIIIWNLNCMRNQYSYIINKNFKCNKEELYNDIRLRLYLSNIFKNIYISINNNHNYIILLQEASNVFYELFKSIIVSYKNIFIKYEDYNSCNENNGFIYISNIKDNLKNPKNILDMFNYNYMWIYKESKWIKDIIYRNFLYNFIINEKNFLFINVHFKQNYLGNFIHDKYNKKPRSIFDLRIINSSYHFYLDEGSLTDDKLLDHIYNNVHIINSNFNLNFDSEAIIYDYIIIGGDFNNYIQFIDGYKTMKLVPDTITSNSNNYIYNNLSKHNKLDHIIIYEKLNP